MNTLAVNYSKLKQNTKIGFQYRLSLNAHQSIAGEHSAILWTFIKLPFSIKTFVLSIFKWPLKTGFTVVHENIVLFSLKLSTI